MLIYENKLIIFGFGTVDQREQEIKICHFGLWEIKMGIYPIFLYI